MPLRFMFIVGRFMYCTLQVNLRIQFKPRCKKIFSFSSSCTLENQNKFILQSAGNLLTTYKNSIEFTDGIYGNWSNPQEITISSDNVAVTK